jgi:hypothetical protein
MMPMERRYGNGGEAAKREITMYHTFFLLAGERLKLRCGGCEVFLLG